MTKTITPLRRSTVHMITSIFESAPATVQEDAVDVGATSIVDERYSDKLKPPKSEGDTDGAKRLLLEKLQAAFDGPGDYRAALARLRKILADIDGGSSGKPAAESAPMFRSQAARLSYLRGMSSLDLPGVFEPDSKPDAEQERQRRIQRLRA